MAKYVFTCPLTGCGLKMSADTQSEDEAARQLIEQAKEHLQTGHPDIHKTGQEVEEDILAHMVLEGE